MRQCIIPVILLLMTLANGWTQAQTIRMRVPDTTMLSGGNIDIPVYADSSLAGKNVMSYTLQFTFNQSLFQVVSVITSGTLSDPFGSPVVNTSVPGKITIASAGSSALTGKGKFIYIRFKALQPGGLSLSFTGAENNYFNEGLPVMTFDDGYINITAPPAITVNPDNGIITKGETLQFYHYGGTAPFQWFVTNPGVASINSAGLLTGLQAGFTNVVVVDNNGLRDTTNSFIDIRAMRLSIPTNLSQWQGADIDVPVNTTDITGLDLFSGNFTINFNSNLLVPFGIVQTGTLLSSYPAPTANFSVPGVVSIAFAGLTPLTGTGTLIYVRFHVSSIISGETTLNFVSGLFNEGYIPTFTNGFFHSINLPVLSITPNAGFLVAGQSQQFTLNGGATLPVVWSVNNPAIASVSSTGLATTLKGGNLTVSAVDAHGATASTGTWLIYDTRIIMPDTSTCSSTYFFYPIYITALPAGESVNSVQAEVTYNSTLLTFQELVSTGTLTQGWYYASNPTIGHINFAGSGTTSFNTAGALVILKFQINPGFMGGSSASIQLTNVLLNEGMPDPLVDNAGSISRIISGIVPSVTISANPTGTFCEGISVLFTSSTVNGGTPTYQWRKNGADIPGATDASYSSSSLINGNSITCAMTSSLPCVLVSPAISNAIVLSLNPLPVAAGTIAGENTVVQGQAGVNYSIPVIMHATGYNWTLSPGASITSGANTSNIIVSFSASATSGVMTVYGTNGCGNGASSANFNIVVNSSLPIQLNIANEVVPTGITTCYNASQTIFVAGSGTTFIIQNGGSTTMIAGQNILYLPGTTVQSGGYMWGYIAPTGPWCLTPSMPAVVTAEYEERVATEQSSFKVYPNPTTGNFILELIRDADQVKVGIYGIWGEMVLSTVLYEEGRYEFSLADQTVGIYFIRVIYGDKAETVAIIKQ
jgi:hypothetical protein